ncbi:hypothetical protein EXIGLDRAFT_634875 [Exidia glandulosa HHB12029]|uniref:Uncharacterized protein n=1 Tax=Exidia glandulosa HHB12029 TaxID=1314781 RepID=A0A166MAL4_EXIGL|nr:hypothetical protein EXIGLDRAFT_634875 [Exidia glandulosa HHB12029]
MAFLRQFWALFKKNWIVLSKHWVLNLLRCFVLLVAFGVFLGVAQVFLIKPNNLGLGTIVPIDQLATVFDPDSRFIWVDASNGTSTPPAQQLIDRLTRDFSERQKSKVERVENAADVAGACPQNFQLYSECYAALIINPGTMNYTLRGDAGFFFVDVERHTSDFEKRVLPLQAAVDAVSPACPSCILLADA